jgi:hypothetical protein
MGILEQLLTEVGIAVGKKDDRIIVVYATPHAVRFDPRPGAIFAIPQQGREYPVIVARTCGIAVASSGVEKVIDFLDENSPREAIVRAYQHGEGVDIAACAKEMENAIGVIRYEQTHAKKEIYEVDPLFAGAFISAQSRSLEVITFIGRGDDIAFKIHSDMLEPKGSIVVAEYVSGNPKIHGGYVNMLDSDCLQRF